MSMDHVNPDGTNLEGNAVTPCLLHVYGQYAFHDDIFLVGNRLALMRLQEAISKALEGSRGVMNAMVTDGEGYSVTVIMNDDQWDGEFWQKIARPYSAPWAADNREEKICPWFL